MSLPWLDLLIVGAYLLGMLYLAFRHRTFAGASMENFFLGGRKVPGWLNGISYTAALVSPDAATGYGGLAVVTGGFVCWWYLSRFGLALFLGGVVFAVFWRRLNLFTSLEFYDLRFPRRAAAAMRLWIAIRTSLIALPAWTGITLLAACKIMEPAFGLSENTTLVMIVLISFLFVFSSGYKGVVISNLIQMVVFLLGTMTLAGLTVAHFGGFSEMAAAINGAYGATNPEMLSTMPPMEHAKYPLALALGVLVGQSIGYGGDAAPMGGAMEGQRILSTRTPSEALTMYVVAALSMFVLLLLVSLPCVSAAVIWPEYRQGADPEQLYGRLMKEMLPVGAMGLMIAAMLAAAMSTVADNLNFGSQVLISDLYRRWFVPAAPESHYLLASKFAMAIILAMAITVVKVTDLIVEVAFFMVQLSTAEMSANWAQWWWWRFNGYARIAASFGGALIFGIIVLVPKALVYFGVAWASSLILPWATATLLIMALTTALWVTVALLTKPDPDALLRGFYTRAHPLGCWTPFRSSNDAEARSGSYGPVLRGIGIAALGFVATSLLITGLTHAWFAKMGNAALNISAAAVLFVAFRKLSVSYLAFLDARFEEREAVACRADDASQPVTTIGELA